MKISNLDIPAKSISQKIIQFRFNLGSKNIETVIQTVGRADTETVDITDLWDNNVKYAQLLSADIFDGSLEAYTYPPEFAVCLGIESAIAGMLISQQARLSFGLSYRTWKGSEAAGGQAEYQLHVIYGCIAQPSEVARATINDSPEATSFSWEFKTTPADMTGELPVSKITIDSADLTVPEMQAVKDALWGVDTPTDAYLPLPDALLTLATP